MWEKSERAPEGSGASRITQQSSAIARCDRSANDGTDDTADDCARGVIVMAIAAMAAPAVTIAVGAVAMSPVVDGIANDGTRNTADRRARLAIVKLR
jgi:hypothetical protein